MNDVLKVALERQTELRAEIAEIDDFIRMAESILRSSRRAEEQRSERPANTAHPASSERPARPAHADQPARQDQAHIVELPDNLQEHDAAPMARKFPWSSTQAAARKSDADDDGGPTRRNLMRREAG